MEHQLGLRLSRLNIVCEPFSFEIEWTEYVRRFFTQDMREQTNENKTMMWLLFAKKPKKLYNELNQKK